MIDCLRPRGSHRVAVVRALVWFGSACAVSALAAPPSAPVAVEDALQRAQTCYAAGNLGCAVDLLQPDAALPPDAPQARQIERWRLLGFAAARLDRADVAKAAFAQLLRLDPKHRLDRDATPPVVWRAFAAAWLQVHGAGLDLEPQVQAHPILPVPKPQPRDWPRYAPPPKSGRDAARDYLLQLAPTVTVNLGTAAAVVKKPIDHVGVLMSLQVEPWPWLRAGLLLHAVRWHDGERTRLRNDIGLCAHGLVVRWPDSRLEVGVEFAGSMDISVHKGAWGAIGAGLRYHAQPARGALGWTVSVGDRQALGGQAENQLLASFGLALQPAAR